MRFYWRRHSQQLNVFKPTNERVNSLHNHGQWECHSREEKSSDSREIPSSTADAESPQKRRWLPFLRVYGQGASVRRTNVFLPRSQRKNVFSSSNRISEILEARGWSRTKDQEVTNFTIKWCLEHQCDWNRFQEGKQLINNIPGQIIFADKVNLWYTIRDYLQQRARLAGNPIQTFLPMTFVLDDETEVNDFIRIYKSRKGYTTLALKTRFSFFSLQNKIEPGFTSLGTVTRAKEFTSLPSDRI